MSRVYHTGVAPTGERIVARRPIATLCGNPVDAGLHSTIIPSCVAPAGY